MRRTKQRRSLWSIVPILIILPPLGLYILWKSPRTVRAKVAVSLLFMLLAGTALAGMVKSGMLGGKYETLAGFDVTMDNQGRYRTPEILPLERDVFNDVVREIRRLPPRGIGEYEDEMTLEAVQPESRAFMVVAEQRGLDYKDVEAIYMKVSSQLAQGKR